MGDCQVQDHQNFMTNDTGVPIALDKAEEQENIALARML
jgi:hypothetical protein